MPHIDDFWDDIVDEGLVDPDQAGRARARFIQVGGGLDTAVLENAPLDADARQRLLEIAAQALGRKLAGPTALADPDREAAEQIPRNIIDRYGVLPARDEQGRLILITPPLAPHVFNEFKARLGRSFDARLALEIDLRLAIARHLDVPLPARFDVLRSGRRPGRSALSGVPARRPVARPPAAASLIPVLAAPEPPPPAPSGEPGRNWLAEASNRLRQARDRQSLFALLADAAGSALTGRFYLLSLGGDRIRCVGGTGLARGAGPTITLHRDSRIDHALRIGSSRLEDWSHDPDLTALYTALGRARPARVMIEPIRDGLEVVGVFVGDHGRAGIDRGVVGTVRRWLSRVSTRLADLRDSAAPGPQAPPIVDGPPASAPPPPRVVPGPPPPAPSTGRPAADPFAPNAAPGVDARRARRRGALDLHELAEAARTAEATADALPPETHEFMPSPPALTGESVPPPFEDPPAAPMPPPFDGSIAPPMPLAVEPTAGGAPAPAAPAPPQAPSAPAFDPGSDAGLPFALDDMDDPLAGFLSDPEIEAVAEAIVADEPGAPDADDHPPPAGDMGRPPHTLPSRPRAMPDEPAPAAPSLFEAIIPRTDGEAPIGGPPAATRPARPSAGRAAPEATEAPATDDRPGPTVNLRGPDAEAERRQRPTADLGPRRADISIDELLEEARALAQSSISAPPPEPPPVRAAAITARSTVDLRGSEPPAPTPPAEPDPEDLRDRKTVNLRHQSAVTAGPRPARFLELDEADVLEESDEPAPTAEPEPELDPLAARRELEEAETGVFTMVGDLSDPSVAPEAYTPSPAEQRSRPAWSIEPAPAPATPRPSPAPTRPTTPEPAPASPADAELAEAETAEMPVAALADDPDLAGAVASVPAPAPQDGAGSEPADGPPPAASPAPDAGEAAPAHPDPEGVAEAIADPPEPAPADETSDDASEPAAPEPAIEGAAPPLTDDAPPDPSSEAGAEAGLSPPDDEPDADPIEPEPAEPEAAEAAEAPSDPEADPDGAPPEADASDPAIALDDLFGAVADTPAAPAKPPPEPSDPAISLDDLFGDVSKAPSTPPEEPSDPAIALDDLFGGSAEAAAPPSPEPPASAPPAQVHDLFAGLDDDIAPLARPQPAPSDPPLALDDLVDPPADEFADLQLSPPPRAHPSPTFEVIGALDLDGAGEPGADFDLDLGLDAAASAESAPPAPITPGVDPSLMAEAVVALTSGDPDVATAAEETLVGAGEAALDALFAAFPGPLLVDRYSAGETAPVSQHGPVLRTICRIGAPAGPYLAARCDHLAPDVRYYAVLAFAAVRDPASVAAISPALTDKDPTVRAVACQVADTYRGEEIFGALVTHLVSIVDKGRLADRRLAAEALGTLHTADGAAALIAMLSAPQPPLRDAAHKALVEIARQDFGDDVWRWRTFFERSAQRPRIEWLLDGLLSDRRNIRLGAFRELRRVTHQNYGYLPDAPPAARRASAERWMHWWHQTGRARFGHYR